MMSEQDKPDLRDRLFVIIFGTDTPMGKRFDVILLWLIVISTLVVMLESVAEFKDRFGDVFLYIEYVFTFVFSVEYILRLWTARKPLGYAMSFYGIVDLLSFLPTYLAIFITSSQYLMVIRIFRLMRIFRVLKIARFMNEADALWISLKSSRAKISVFLFAVLNVAVIMGTIMYIVEGGENGFTSIPRGVYWAIVTMTTVGFGDIHPHTDLGQFFSMILMVLGYGVIAVPTGIIGVEMFKDNKAGQKGTPVTIDTRHCNNCGRTGHLPEAKHCLQCGAEL